MNSVANLNGVGIYNVWQKPYEVWTYESIFTTSETSVCRDNDVGIYNT